MVSVFDINITTLQNPAESSR